VESEQDRREWAIKRLKAKRGLRAHLTVYLLVSALLVAIWAVSGAAYFWPVWPIAGWGIGVVMHGLGAFGQKPISEEEIRREMERGE